LDLFDSGEDLFNQRRRHGVVPAFAGDDVLIFIARAASKKPGHSGRAFDCSAFREAPYAASSATALGVRIGVNLAAFAGLGFRLRPAPRALRELAFDLLHRFGLGDVLHHRDLTRQAVQRCFIELAFAVGLLGGCDSRR
jgi:hypothetical protein